MELKDFILLSKEAQFDLLSDPMFGKSLDGTFEIYFRKSDLSLKALIQVLKINAATRNGGNNSFRRMIHFVLASNFNSQEINTKELAEYIIESQSEYSNDRKKCLEFFLK